jgi:hypothetical protein
MKPIGLGGWSLNPRPLMLRSGAAPFIALKPFNSYRRLNRPRPEERALARVSKDGHKRDRASGHASQAVRRKARLPELMSTLPCHRRDRPDRDPR